MEKIKFDEISEWIKNKKNSNQNNKIILITGGAGFIGVNLTIELLKNNNNYIVCIDNLLVSDDKYINDLILLDDRYKFIKWNVCEIFQLDCVDEIYHLASIASPDKYKKYSIETIMVNFIGTKNMLDLAIKNNSKLLFTSTSEIYGDPLVHPQPEEYWVMLIL